MIELFNNELTFRFPQVHDDAECEISFQRTLRIPDDNRDYPLPPGLGRFPVSHVDDYPDSLPPAWLKHGGVLLPMYQSEALWISLDGDYPCAVMVATGKINAVSGERWSEELQQEPQNYVVIPEQPWLDGFNVAEGLIRQFIAMPMDEGFTAEEQITGEAEHGGLQLLVFPMKEEAYEKYISPLRVREFNCLELCCDMSSDYEMGLAPGGLMRQEISEDPYDLEDWDLEAGLRCFVHLTNSRHYEQITGHRPPHMPPTAKQYTDAGLPWFEHYSDLKPLPGSATLGKLGSVGAKMVELGKGVLDDNEPVKPRYVRTLKTERPNNMVRDGSF